MSNYLNSLKELRDLRKENIIFQNISLMQKIDAKLSEYLLKETDRKEKEMILQKINELNKVYFDKEFKVNISLKDILLMKIKDYIFRYLECEYKTIKPPKSIFKAMPTLNGNMLDDSLEAKIKEAKRDIKKYNYDCMIIDEHKNLHLFCKRSLSSEISKFIEREVNSFVYNAIYSSFYLDDLKEEFIRE